MRLPGGGRGASLEGIARGVIVGAAQADASGRLRVAVSERADDVPANGRTRELETDYRATVEEILELRGDDGRVAAFLRSIVDPGPLADTSGYSPDLTFEQKVRLLEEIDVTARLDLALEFQRERLTQMQVRRKIRDDVEGGAQKQQREYFLRKQLESIRRELGEDEGSATEDLRQKIADAGMPDHVREQADRELDRLERVGEQGGGEGQMIRTYLDWLVSVPWSERSDEVLDPIRAREVLDADHAGLEDVKDRIVEYIAVRKLRVEREIEADKKAGAILTLIGPPGTGKTSIGESIARATGREFVRMSLGGVRDEAEIRGHRRTYVGALPGRLIRALRDAGTMNPVIMLDEVDKVGADWRGDPSSALLEVLDPAQNDTFRDHYLDVEIDLSEVMFIATANMAETIPGPLLDRMEVIRFDGYTVEEKTAIARDYLVKRQRERNGLREDEVVIGDDVLRTLVSEYTREAGVRTLERELGKVLRKVATKVASGSVETPVTIDADVVREALGRQRFFQEAAIRTAVPGVATGLAFTPVGGDVLFIEANGMKGGKGALTLTGQLGDVMKESARIALTYVRAHAAELGIDEAGFDEREFHVHVPAGAIPKDGPSAGVTMTTALASLLTGRPVKHTVGMTGEVTLQGRVLPIGGPQAEGPRRARGGADRRDHPRAQPGRPRRRPGRGARGDDVPPGDDRRRGARARARARDGRRRGVGPRTGEAAGAAASPGRAAEAETRVLDGCPTHGTRKWGYCRRQRVGTMPAPGDCTDRLPFTRLILAALVAALGSAVVAGAALSAQSASAPLLPDLVQEPPKQLGVERAGLALPPRLLVRGLEHRRRPADHRGGPARPGRGDHDRRRRSCCRATASRRSAVTGSASCATRACPGTGTGISRGSSATSCGATAATCVPARKTGFCLGDRYDAVATGRLRGEPTRPPYTRFCGRRPPGPAAHRRGHLGRLRRRLRAAARGPVRRRHRPARRPLRARPPRQRRPAAAREPVRQQRELRRRDAPLAPRPASSSGDHHRPRVHMHDHTTPTGGRMSTITRKVGVLAALACLAVPPAAAWPAASTTKHGRMTGGGKAMGVADGKAVKVTHGFQLRCRTTSVPQRLQVNWSGGGKFHLDELTFASCIETSLDQENPSAPFDTYSARVGRDGSYAEWTFTDDGEPGRTDGFKITVWESEDAAEDGEDPILEVDDDLSLGGNHQAHRVTGSLAR